MSTPLTLRESTSFPNEDTNHDEQTFLCTSMESTSDYATTKSEIQLALSSSSDTSSFKDTLSDKESQTSTLAPSLRRARNLLGRLKNLDIRPSLPLWISRFLGYRPNGICRPIWALRWLEAFNIPLVVEDYCFAIFCTIFGMISVIAVNSMTPFATLPIPLTLGFVGSLSVILYVTPHSPAAAPRSVLLSHLFASALATVIAKLFLKDERVYVRVDEQMSTQTVWVWACAAVTLTLVFQKAFNLVHPPAAGTVLLGTVQSNFIRIGWIYVAFVMSSVTIMFGTALVWGNVGRRYYPVYWFTSPMVSPDLSPSSPSKKSSIIDLEAAYYPTKTDLKEVHSLDSSSAVTQIQTIESLSISSK